MWMSTTVGRRPPDEEDMERGRWEGCDWLGGTCGRPCACAERGDTSGGTTPVVVGWVLVKVAVEVPPDRRDWARFSRVGSACDKQFRIF